MARTNDEFNRIVRRLWSVLVGEGLTDDDASEVVGRLVVSIALARAGGDPRAAARRVKEHSADMVRALRDPDTKVQSIVVAKGAG